MKTCTCSGRVPARLIDAPALRSPAQQGPQQGHDQQEPDQLRSTEQALILEINFFF